MKAIIIINNKCQINCEGSISEIRSQIDDFLNNLSIKPPSVATEVLKELEKQDTNTGDCVSSVYPNCGCESICTSCFTH